MSEKKVFFYQCNQLCPYCETPPAQRAAAGRQGGGGIQPAISLISTPLITEGGLINEIT